MSTRFEPENTGPSPKGIVQHFIMLCTKHRGFVMLAAALVVLWGIAVSPFDWDTGPIPKDPVAVDAIPDIGENQQIVFTRWPGRSPKDTQDQVTYPLTVAMLGINGVKTVRSYSMFGFSSIYIIFNDDVDFYWSRTRVLEKLSSLAPNTLPEGVTPQLGPDATGLGQVFWYTLEGRTADGKPTGGWDLDELRTIQDWHVKYALSSAKGIAEVSSVGGFEKQYQIDADPQAMRAFGVSLEELFKAVKSSNLDVGAKTVEINKVEYIVRGIGFIKSTSDIEQSVIKAKDNVPVRVKDVATVSLGPAPRRGLLDKGGTQAVGGVAVVRFGFNPLEAIKSIKEKIKEITPGLPQKVIFDYAKTTPSQITNFEPLNHISYTTPEERQNAWVRWLRTAPENNRPNWVTLSKLTIVPFYDRTELIHKTLGTLNSALVQQIMVTVIVVLVMLADFASPFVISLTLPLAVLACFCVMKTVGVDANIVALSGIAIAIGTIVDTGIVVSESILRKLKTTTANLTQAVFDATSQVGGAVLTSISTTIVSFLPVFTMQGAEGKLFKPLAFTKTFVLLSAVLIALSVVPAVFRMFFARSYGLKTKTALAAAIMLAGLYEIYSGILFTGSMFVVAGTFMLAKNMQTKLPPPVFETARNLCVGLGLCGMLANYWAPLGPASGFALNFTLTAVPIALLLGLFKLLETYYTRILALLLKHKTAFLCLPAALSVFGIIVWLGIPSVLGFLPDSARKNSVFQKLYHAFPGLGQEFMPALDEGAFLYMPTTMPHASIGEVLDVMQKQDMAFAAIPEVELAVGKAGRVESALDPAPISMIETIINYKPEFLRQNGKTARFKFNPDKTDFAKNEHNTQHKAPDGLTYKVRGAFAYENNKLVPDPDGKPFRLWRPALDPRLNPGRQAWAGIKTPQDIWDEITRQAQITGTTSAPKLQPIQARLVMLQSGMRAPMGIKVKGSSQENIEKLSLELEQLLKHVPGVAPETVLADRTAAKPYFEIHINRREISRYGISLEKIQNVIQTAIGGKNATMTVEGTQRHAVRLRYARQLRSTPEQIGQILVESPASGEQIPLIQLADIRYVRGPQVLKSEDTFALSYVLFDKKPGFAEINVVKNAQSFLAGKIADGTLIIPPGCSFVFAGNYENQLRAQKTLSIVVPIALVLIFMILYMQFGSFATCLIVFSGVCVAWAGGFAMIWLYGQEWFLNLTFFGSNLREVFNIHTINLSVAVWVGFLALFGIATDDGVVMASFLDQNFKDKVLQNTAQIHTATLEAASKRIRPCLLTTATTVLALLPVLSAAGTGADIMIPMAIPCFGGMVFELITMFVVPVLYCWMQELKLGKPRT